MGADCVAEHVKNQLAHDEEENSENDISKGPSILQGVGNKDDLHDQVHDDAYAIDDV
jgi:hypothetical protein